MLRQLAALSACSGLALLLGSAVATPFGAVADAPPSASGADGETIGFALTQLLPTMTEKPNCPKGLNIGLDQYVLSKASPEERARLQASGSSEEVRRRSWFFTDGDLKGKLICHHPAAYTAPTPNHVLVEGSDPVPGLDLDGMGSLQKTTGGHCAHQNFADSSGRVTVDNQMYRLDGCIKGKQWGGTFRTSAMADLVNGSHSILIEISGVNDRRNDPSVEVGIYSSPDPTPFSGAGKALPNGSLTVTAEKRFIARTRGRIVKGVLTTEPTDLVLYTPSLSSKFEQAFREARLQLTLKPDGTAEGVLGGYRPIEDYYFNQFTQRGHSNSGLSAQSNNYMCPSLYRAFYEQADGLFNPKTGKCEGISAALMLTAQPAYVIKP